MHLVIVLIISFVVQLNASPTPLWNDNRNLRPKQPKQIFQKRKLKRDPIIKFDYPIEYNKEVRNWIKFFQTGGRQVFTNWLKRSQLYMPQIQRILKDEGLPTDLAYIAMIESGFVAHAISPANAVGPWQFIAETGNRYGLATTWWLDERRDFEKSTRAAAKYLRYMYSMFNCWNLAAAGYNTGENRIARLMERHNTNSFWRISQLGGISRETREYVPKLIATMLIAKAPEAYGFKKIPRSAPLRYEHFIVPGGTRLDHLALQAGISKTSLRNLNPELIRGYIPFHVTQRAIKIPLGSGPRISKAIRAQLVTLIDSNNVTDMN